MRESQYLNALGYLQSGIPENASVTHSRITVAALADLLSSFSGDTKELDSCRKPFAPARARYWADRGASNILIRMRLKERTSQ